MLLEEISAIRLAIKQAVFIIMCCSIKCKQSLLRYTYHHLILGEFIGKKTSLPSKCATTEDSFVGSQMTGACWPGLVDLSPGFNTQLSWQPGAFMGQQLLWVQTDAKPGSAFPNREERWLSSYPLHARCLQVINNARKMSS